MPVADSGMETRVVVAPITCFKQGQVLDTALRISFDDISLCNYRVIFKILLEYRYRIFFENIT